MENEKFELMLDEAQANAALEKGTPWVCRIGTSTVLRDSVQPWTGWRTGHFCFCRG